MLDALEPSAPTLFAESESANDGAGRTTNYERKIPLAFARNFGVFCREEDNCLILVHRNDTCLDSILEARRILAHSGRYNLLALQDKAFDDALNASYEQDSAEAMQMVQGLGDELDLDSLANSVPEAEDLLSREDDAPIIRLINAVLNEAVKQGASDVHIETYERSLAVRFRIDGVLRTAVQPRRELAALLVSRLKVMAKMDIAEKRIPQDGRISLRVGGREVDVRASTLPSSYGERVVLRLLDKASNNFQIDALGLDQAALLKLRDIINQPHGIFLVTGPTGSGKSTTLYSSLIELNDYSRNILTIEDPIEYNLEGIGQSQVNLKADMTFARGLRAMLRQDPDVVMVGEIRDAETAEIAVQASLTGHMVMSTLHTNSAAGAITRMQDMGIEPFLLSSSLVGVLAQRLVRTLCPSCKSKRTADDFERQLLQQEYDKELEVAQAIGCEECSFTGYKGRKGIYELLAIDSNIRQLIHGGASEAELETAARKSSMSIQESGLQCVRDHTTTVEEVLRVTQSEQ
ncbi:MAG: type II secretion system ATPase GspE [Pseudomonadota bacterium]